MQRKIPTIKIHSPSQVDNSIANRHRNTYKSINQQPQLEETSPPLEFYDSNVDMGRSNTLFYTALDKTPSLENEDEPPYIDLDKDLLKPKSSQSINHSIYQTPSGPCQTPNVLPQMQSPFQFATPQASSTKRHENWESLSEAMSSIHINLTEVEELVEDPYFSNALSDLIDGVPVDSDSDYTKYGIIELFDRYCMKEQDRYRNLMKSSTEAKNFTKVNLENLDYETTFIDLSTETSAHPPNAVSTAINCLTRAEIKNEIYRTMMKNKTSGVKFVTTEAKSTAFIPETKGNVEILTYLGSTGHAKDTTRKNEHENVNDKTKSGMNENNEKMFTGDRNSTGPGLGRPISRWENLSNLADSS